MKKYLCLACVVFVASACYKTSTDLVSSPILDSGTTVDAGLDATSVLDSGADLGADAGRDASGPPSSDPCAHVAQSITGGDPNAPVSQHASASGTERDLVVFTSAATNLVSDTLTPGVERLFLRDCATGHTELLVDAPIGDGIDIAGDQSEVVFSSSDSSLVPGDTNGYVDVFKIALDTRVIERVSVLTDGSQFVENSTLPRITLGTLSARAYIFQTSFGDLPSSLFVHHSSGITQRVAYIADGGFDIGADGRCAVYRTNTGAVTYDPSIWETGDEQELFTPDSGAPSYDVRNLTISSDCRYIGFVSERSSLVPGDTNGAADAFVYNTATHTTSRLNKTATDAEMAGGDVLDLDLEFFPIGSYYIAVYSSTGTNLFSPPTSGAAHVYISYFYADFAGGRAELVDGVLVDATTVTYEVSTGYATTPHIDPNGERVTFLSQGSNFAGPVVDVQSLYSMLPTWRI